MLGPEYVNQPVINLLLELYENMSCAKKEIGRNTHKLHTRETGHPKVPPRHLSSHRTLIRTLVFSQFTIATRESHPC